MLLFLIRFSRYHSFLMKSFFANCVYKILLITLQSRIPLYSYDGHTDCRFVQWKQYNWHQMNYWHLYSLITNTRKSLYIKPEFTITITLNSTILLITNWTWQALIFIPVSYTHLKYITVVLFNYLNKVKFTSIFSLFRGRDSS